MWKFFYYWQSIDSESQIIKRGITLLSKKPLYKLKLDDYNNLLMIKITCKVDHMQTVPPFLYPKKKALR